MIDSPATLMFAGAAIGGTVAYLYFHGRLSAVRRSNADLAGRAAAAGAHIQTQKRSLDTLGKIALGHIDTTAKLQRAMEALNAAAAQNTIAGARKVIAEKLEQIRCMGRDEQEAE